MRSQRRQAVSEGLSRLDQIYFVSAKIFCKKGYDASSMSDIADAVGIGYNPVTALNGEMAGLTPAHRRKVLQRKRTYFDLVRDTLLQLKTEGKLKDVDTTVAAFSLFGMLLWLSRWYRIEGRLSGEEIANELEKIALGGMLRPQARLAGK